MAKGNQCPGKSEGVGKFSVCWSAYSNNGSVILVNEREHHSLGYSVLRLFWIYGLWALSAALSLYSLLWVRVFVLVEIPMSLFRVNPWVLRFLDRWGSVLLLLMWLILAIGSETIFRRLPEHKDPVRTVARVFGVEVLMLAIAYGGHLIIS